MPATFHQDVDGPEVGQDLFESGVGAARVADVGLRRQRYSTAPPDLPGRLPDRVEVDVDGRHPGAVPGELQGDPPADAGSGPGDDCLLAAHVHLIRPPSR